MVVFHSILHLRLQLPLNPFQRFHQSLALRKRHNTNLDWRITLIPTLQLLFNVLTDFIEVGMLHALLCGEALLPLTRATHKHLMIVDEDVIEEVVQLDTDQIVPSGGRKLAPVSLSADSHLVHHLGVHFQLIRVDVLEQVFGAEHVHDLAQLVHIPMRAEEWALVENERGEHAPERPNVHGVIVVLDVTRSVREDVIVGEQLGPLVVARAHAHVELFIYP